MQFMPEPYSRRVYYYETDNMGIVHHANYIRWMEEARMDFMRKIGYVYTDMEADGIIMPVTGVSCRYIHSMHFDDVFSITVKMTKFSGVRLSLSYQIFSVTDGILAAEGESSHCFLDAKSRFPVNLKKYCAGFCEKALELTQNNE
ncbi:MAG: acyl-CoA thioesterase [Oscillospiraceae bacterium]